MEKPSQSQGLTFYKIIIVVREHVFVRIYRLQQRIQIRNLRVHVTPNIFRIILMPIHCIRIRWIGITIPVPIAIAGS